MLEIEDLVICDNDNVLPRESKMILNLLLSGTADDKYFYKDISDKIYRKYNTYIRFNRFDRFSKDKNNVAKRDVGYYCGEIVKLCHEKHYPLLPVNVMRKDIDKPGNGFFELCYTLGFDKNQPKEEFVKEQQEEINKRFDEIKAELPRYINENS